MLPWQFVDDNGVLGSDTTHYTIPSQAYDSKYPTLGCSAGVKM